MRDIKSLSTKKRFWVFIMLTTLLAMAFIVVSQQKEPVDTPSVKEGSLDLSLWQPNDTISLKGQWNFYQNQLITNQTLWDSTSLQRPGERTESNQINVPSVWEDLPFGYATYHLIVTGVPEGQMLGLYMPSVSTACRVYCNDTLIYEAGRVAVEKENSVAAYKTGVAIIDPLMRSSGSLDGGFHLWIQVSNYEYGRAGLWHDPILGSYEGMIHYADILGYKDMLLMGATLFLATYLLFLYFSLKKEKSNFILGALSLVIFIRIATTGTYTIGQIFPQIPFRLSFFLEYGSLIWIPVTVVFLCQTAFAAALGTSGKERLITKIILWNALTLTSAILLMPIAVTSSLLPYVQLTGTLAGLYAIILTMQAERKGETGAMTILLGVYVALIFAMYDVLYYANVITSKVGELLSTGLFMAILFQGFALARRSAKAFRDVEDSVEKTIAAEVAFLQAQINPHFFYNTLNTISSFCYTEPRRAAELIGNFAEHLRFHFDFKTLSMFHSLKKELEVVKSYLAIEKARYGDQIQVEYRIEGPLEVQVPTLSIQPLVENAILHGLLEKDEPGRLLIEIRSISEAELEISVTDDGPGMAKEIQNGILTGNQLPNPHSDSTGGIGLWNLQSRLFKHYHKGLIIHTDPTSTLGIGTRISFRIPIERSKL